MIIFVIKQLFDFHTHSTASDGLLSPKELVRLASKEGVSALALTDHDTLSGIEEGIEEAAKCGITLIPGIELDIVWQPGEFHLLGLGLKSASPSMKDIIASSRRSREERNKKIENAMQKAGINISLESLAMLYPGRPIGRPHFADYLVSMGIVKERQEAFDKYLGKGKPWYAERTGADMEKAVQAIKECGGVSVIAHPMSLHISWGHLAKVFSDIKECGVAGAEAWHPAAREADCRRIERMAHEAGLLVSAGSDYHGELPSLASAEKASGGHKIRHLAHSAGGHCITAAYIDKELRDMLGAGDKE